MVGYDRVLKVLEAEAGRRPARADTIDLYRKLIECQAEVEVPPSESDISISAEEATARLERGEPLLSPDTVDIDSVALAELCGRIAFIIAEKRRESDLIKSLAKIHAWLQEQREETRTLAVEYLRKGHVVKGEEAGLDGPLLSLIFALSLRPLLRAQAQALSPYVDDSLWYRGCCPVCGGEPDIAALEHKSGRRRLLCSRCDSEWTFLRVACPFCGNEDPSQLAYYPGDDKVHRLNVCDRCHRYLKTVDLRETSEERLLPAERILTIDMDFAAQRAGYRVG
jgi:FdhE protein